MIKKFLNKAFTVTTIALLFFISTILTSNAKSASYNYYSANAKENTHHAMYQIAGNTLSYNSDGTIKKVDAYDNKKSKSKKDKYKDKKDKYKDKKATISWRSQATISWRSQATTSWRSQATTSWRQ